MNPTFQNELQLKTAEAQYADELRQIFYGPKVQGEMPTLKECVTNVQWLHEFLLEIKIMLCYLIDFQRYQLYNRTN